jgi:Purple acid Phosphatase, N-terminal domain
MQCAYYQILNFAADASQMIISWVTLNSTKSSVVEYGISSLTFAAKGVENPFTDGGSEKRVIYVHTVTITGLTPGNKYSKPCLNEFRIALPMLY